MADFEIVETEARSYIAQERSCSMDPNEISAAMGQAFGAVMGFVQAKGITPQSPPMSLYETYDPDRMTFRAGFFVSPDDAAKAGGDVIGATIPAGRAVHFTHKGSYATLRDHYGDMMRFIEENGLQMQAPTWELYMNDPGETPEAELLTEVYSRVG